MRVVAGKLTLLPIVVMGLACGGAFAQQAAPSSPTAAPNAASGTPRPTTVVINPVNSSPSTVTLAPNGARRASSISTVVVCDFSDLSGAYPAVDDVCSIGR